MIVVLMREQGLDLQSAFDYIGQLCKGAIQHFEDNRTVLPSWGEELDWQVAIYIEGLQNWLSVLLTGPSTPPVISRRMGMLSSGTAWSSYFPKGPH
jgi:hypothetical protein